MLCFDFNKFRGLEAAFQNLNSCLNPDSSEKTTVLFHVGTVPEYLLINVLSVLTNVESTTGRQSHRDHII
jgi:hypothetical protein